MKLSTLIAQGIITKRQAKAAEWFRANWVKHEDDLVALLVTISRETRLDCVHILNMAVHDRPIKNDAAVEVALRETLNAIERLMNRIK